MKRRLLLTGGSGMVGKNVREHPAAAQWDIMAPVRKELDLTNYQLTLNYIKQNQPDIIIHTAGLVGGIHTNMASPVDFLIQNLEMGKNIVLAAREAGVTKLINLGSSCMYPRHFSDMLSEEHILCGELEQTNEGYALAKNIVLRLCQYIYREDQRYHYKTLIPCNLYGRHDKFSPKLSHLLPAIIHKIHTAKSNAADTVEIWGDGNARREFLYAGDLADAILKAALDYDATPAVMNVGLGYDFTINEYYATVAKIIGWDGTFEHDLSKPVGVQKKLMNIEKQFAWGWQANTALDQGIRETYSYYLQTADVKMEPAS